MVCHLIFLVIPFFWVYFESFVDRRYTEADELVRSWKLCHWVFMSLIRQSGAEYSLTDQSETSIHDQDDTEQGRRARAGPGPGDLE